MTHNNYELYELRLSTPNKRIYDDDELSLAPGLPPAKSGRACYDNPAGRREFLSDVHYVYLYSLFKWNSKVLFKKPGTLKC